MTSTEIPILLLKTRSVPHDSYEDHLSKLNPAFIPTFIPVLEHKPKLQTLDHVRRLLQEQRFGTAEDAEYGGMILTSQRAVEALANVVEEIKRKEMSEIESTSTVRCLVCQSRRFSAMTHTHGNLASHR